MSSGNYWIKRAEERFSAAERVIEDQQEELTHFFDEALKETQSVVRDFWGRYARNNKISYGEAQKLLNFEELKEFRGDLKSFEELAKSSIGTFNLELDNLSIKSRITRYQALEMRLKAVTENLTGKNENMIRNTAGKICEDSYYKTLFDVEQYRGFHENFVGLDHNLIQELVSQPVAGSTFSQSIWKNQQELNYKVRQALTNGLAIGKDPYKMSKEFSKEFGVSRYNAYRLLYTESTAVHSDAQMRAYAEEGVTRYEIVATLDSKTSQICQDMDGEKFEVDKAQKGENCPPFHPWCRTNTAPVIEELEDVKKTGTRAARNPSTGKTERVPASMKYDEWSKVYGQKKDTVIDSVREDMLKQAETLSDNEKDIIQKMTGSLSQKINSLIKLGNSEKYVREMNLLDAAIAKGKITDTVKLYRKTDVRLLDVFPVGGKIDEKTITDLIDKIVTNQIYTSTSFYDWNYLGRNTDITLVVPKGTENALYVKNYAYLQYRNQEEVLFGRGLRYKILNAILEEGRIKILAEVIP